MDINERNNKALEKTDLAYWLFDCGDDACEVEIPWLEPETKRAMGAYKEGRNKAKEEIKNKLFEFLWERGGKKYASYAETFSKNVENAKWEMENDFESIETQNFLDCVAIDEKRVKKLIKEGGLK